MNTLLNTAPRLSALAFATLMTLATLAGVSQVADQRHAAVQTVLAQAASGADHG